MNRIFIGFDERQLISYNVLQNSVICRASKPVAITPLVLQTLPITRRGLTPFTFSRFLCPWLCNYEGWSLFLDADMLVLGDITEIFDAADPAHAVMVVKNKIQFEWPSMMLFNNEKSKALTPEFVQNDQGLFKLTWASSVGDLPSEWNHCVGYDEPRQDAKLVHFTQGIPAFPETKTSEYAEQWGQELKACNSTMPWAALMGTSVHAKHVYERLSKEGVAA